MPKSRAGVALCQSVLAKLDRAQLGGSTESSVGSAPWMGVCVWWRAQAEGDLANTIPWAIVLDEP